MKKSRYLAIITLLLIMFSFSFEARAEKELDSRQIIDDDKIAFVINAKKDIEPVELSLKQVLEKSLKRNLNIAINREKVKEKEIQLDDVRKKKFLLLLKFTNPVALECSAMFALNASKENFKAIVNQTLLDASKKYYNLLKTLLNKQIADEFLQKGQLALKNNEELLKHGSVTKFEVSQTKVFLESLKQKLLEAEILYMVSSVDLAQYINLEGLQVKIIPEEYKNIDHKTEVELLNLIPENILLGDCIDYALKNRPEIIALTNNIASLKELRKNSKFDEVKTETYNSQIRQTKHSLTLLKNTIKTTVTNALLKLIGSESRIDVARQKYELALQAHTQAIISREEGFHTNKEVLDSQVELAVSKNGYIEAIISYNVAQLNLLYELGKIDIESILLNKPVDLTECTPKIKEPKS